MRKRNVIVSLLLVVSMLFGMTVNVFGASSDFVIKNGVLFSYNGMESKVIVPEGVTIINELAFSQNEVIEEVMLPSSLKTIGNGAFRGCINLKKIDIPEGVETIGQIAFGYCLNLKEITIPSSIKRIGEMAFHNCDVKTIVFNNGIQEIKGKNIFISCLGQKDIIIPSSVKNIDIYTEESPFAKYDTIYGVPGSYAESYAKQEGTQFKPISEFYAARTEAPIQEIPTQNESNTVPEVKKEESTKPTYNYNETDVGEGMALPKDKVAEVTDKTTAQEVVMETVQTMTEEQKTNATAIDKIMLLAEEAAANARAVSVEENNITIEDAFLQPLAITPENLLQNAELKLQRKGIQRAKVRTTAEDTVVVEKKALSSSDLDEVKVETPFVGVTLKKESTETVTLENQGTQKVKVDFGQKKTESTVKVSFPNIDGNQKYLAVVDEDGNPVGGKYNPATGELEAKISESGIYTVVNNEKDFSDIKGKSQEMQEAIRLLASKGILNGTSSTTFSPDNSISRAEVASIIMKTIAKYDANEDGGFKDVTKENWYFGVAGSSKKHGIVNGYPDNTFKGTTVIPKDQILSVAARVLEKEMRYYVPENPGAVLAVYGDAGSIANWAKPEVALATQVNLVLQRTDGLFGGSDEMTRGDAAILLKRLFDKIW